MLDSFSGPNVPLAKPHTVVSCLMLHLCGPCQPVNMP